jgi:diaminohydroxyphosphoribosylaminopyrimidine deaminase/5-amino-6-(5-phosphoribosylamino)uracil reductase
MPPDDATHMRAALALAQRGLGECWPNPSVGCVITRNGRVIARARTAPGGRPHAETQALAAAGPGAQGATAYITLEPCAHHGHTPPCAQALIAAGIARAVIALPDPDPRTNGAGIAQLRAAGIQVETGLLEPQAAHLAEGFLRRIRDHRPLVTLKLATTLDGRIATHSGESQWITGPQARRAAHALRASHDAIMVGVGTILADDPRLTCRLPGARTTPLVRVIADSHLRTRLTSAILSTAHDQPTWFLTRPGSDPDRIRAVTSCGAEVIEVPPGTMGIDLPHALRRLAERGLTRLLVEGGAHLAAALLRDDLVDRIAWFHAPAMMGGDGFPAVQAFGVRTLADMPRFAPSLHAPGALALSPDTLTLLERHPG